MKPEDVEYLRYALRSIDDVLGWTATGKESFLEDGRTRSAVLYRLQTLIQALHP